MFKYLFHSPLYWYRRGHKRTALVVWACNIVLNGAVLYFGRRYMERLEARS